MSDISEIQVGGTTYTIADATARGTIDNMADGMLADASVTTQNDNYTVSLLNSANPQATITSFSIPANSGNNYTEANIIEIIANAIATTGSEIDVNDYGENYLELMNRTRESWYGTSSTAATTTAKVITCTSFPSYRKGDIITILFTYSNTATAPTLNVNSKGAKSICVNDEIASASNPCVWPANTLVTFIYDGTYYKYLGQQRGGKSFYGTCSTTTQTLVGTCAEYELTKGSLITLQMTAANEDTSAKTLNVNSTGAKNVYYNNAATSTSNTLTWKSGEILQFIYDGSYYRFVGRSSGGEVEIPNEIVVTAAEPTGTDVMLWIDPSNNATVMAAGVSF